MDLEIEYFMSSIAAVYNIVKEKDRTVKVKGRVRDRGSWENDYRNWDDHMFKRPLRVNKETFIFLLLQIRIDIEKTPIRMKSNPIKSECQLAITLCKLAHGCSLTTLEDLFGWSIPTCTQAFNKICRVLVKTLYRYVKLPETGTK